MFKYLDEHWPNWRTSIAGLGVAVSAAIYDASVNGTLHKSTIVGILFTAAWAFFSKDKAVTGGSVPQTPEAVMRAEPVSPKATEVAERIEKQSPRSSSGVPRYPGSQPR